MCLINGLLSGRKVTGNPNIALHFAQLRHLGAATIRRQWAAGMEDTARRYIEQRGRETRDTCKEPLRLSRGQAGDQHLCIVVAWSVENLTYG
jgi:hypothetical protein